MESVIFFPGELAEMSMYDVPYKFQFVRKSHMVKWRSSNGTTVRVFGPVVQR